MAQIASDDVMWPDMLIERLTSVELICDRLKDSLETIHAIRGEMSRSLYSARIQAGLVHGRYPGAALFGFHPSSVVTMHMDVPTGMSHDVRCFAKLRFCREGHVHSYIQKVMGFDSTLGPLALEFEEFAIRQIVGGSLTWAAIKSVVANHNVDRVTKTQVPSFAFVPNGHHDDNPKYRLYDQKIAPELALDDWHRTCVVQELFSRFICFKVLSLCPPRTDWDYATEYADVNWKDFRQYLDVIIQIHTTDMAQRIPTLIQELAPLLGFTTEHIVTATFVEVDDEIQARVLAIAERTGCDEATVKEELVDYVGNEKDLQTWAASLPPTFNAYHLARQLDWRGSAI